MVLLLPLLTVLAQVGPFTPVGASRAPNVPHIEGRDAPRRKGVPAPAALPPALPSQPQSCAKALEISPSEAIGLAETALASAKDGAEQAAAQGCLGLAHGRLAEWGEAESAFLAARDAVGDDRAARASFGAMAGNAALAGGQPDRAMASLTTAQADADAAADKAASGAIAIDRARALVALRRVAEARAAIDQAITQTPGDSDAWLLSATLYRRSGQLNLAQQHIEKAAAINSLDPAIGLEAGVVAQLSGREAAARKSWQSVIATAPDSPEAAQARNYVAQIGPNPPSTL
jgi:tetratricopeptide (TPR) repeat protein